MDSEHHSHCRHFDAEGTIPSKRRARCMNGQPLVWAQCYAMAAIALGRQTTGGKPRPVFSEHRLAQLMAARGTQRGVLLTRAARTLARSRTEESGINILDIACTLLAPDNGRHLAEPYYRRLDRAERAVDKPEEGIT